MPIQKDDSIIPLRELGCCNIDSIPYFFEYDSSKATFLPGNVIAFGTIESI